MRSKGLDGGTWSAFWLAVLGNSVNVLSVFFVCDSDSCILIVTVVLGPVAVFCMVYHYTKRAMLTRLLDNMGPAIYVVLLNKYFVILPVLIQ